MTTRVPIRYGGTGANTAPDARTALGVPPLAAYDVANSASSTANAAYSQANTAYGQANSAFAAANNRVLKAGDTMTGQLNISSGGLLVTGNVGIGTSTPLEMLDVLGNVRIQNGHSLKLLTTTGVERGTIYATQATGALTAGLVIETSGDEEIVFKDSGEINMVIQGTGATGSGRSNVGIGTTSPTSKLHVVGNANITLGINTATVNATTINAQSFITSTGANVYSTALTAYAQANAAYEQANLAYAAANNSNLLSGGLITGTINVTQDLIVGGNIYLEGNTTFINVTTYSVQDPLIYLASNNDLTDSVDIGFMGGKNTSGTYSHTGLARDATDGKWKLFDGLADEGHVGNIVDFANTTVATIVANIEANNITLMGNVIATQANLTIANDQANSAANTVRVSQNGSSTLSSKQLNFVNTGNITIAVTDAGNGNANISFDLTTGGGTLSNIAISSNSVFATNANAFNFVNTATVQVTVTPGANGNANISFAAAGSANTSIVHQSFTGDGNTTVYTLSSEPEDLDHTLVFVDLVYQPQSAYSLNGNDLEFDTAPDNGSSIDIYVYGAGGTQVAVASDTFTGTGSCTAFTLSQTGVTNRTLVYIDGVSQRPSIDYQVSGTGLSFNVAPANASVIEARTFSNFDATDINVAPVSLTSDRFTGTGSCTVFTLSQTSTTDGTFIFLNGVSQKPGVDYSVTSDVLTLTSAPANGSIVEARTIGQFKVVETSSKIDSDVFTGDGTTTVFAISTSSTTKKAFVYIDGVAQKPYTDYVLTGSRLSFTEPPPNGVKVEVRTFSPFVVAQETLKTLNIYARTGAVAIALTGAGTLTVVGRAANTSIGVS